MEFGFRSTLKYYRDLMFEKTPPGSYTTICAVQQVQISFDFFGKKRIFINLGLL
jgi:hypothetical protein